jgi:uncharacterized iron-regulated membrane protein
MLRLNFKKGVSFLHLWLGLISGLVVFIVGLTGALYSFQDEIKEWVYRDRLYVSVPPETQRLPLSRLISIAEKALGREHPVSRAELSQQPGRTYMFRAVKLNKTSVGYWDYYSYYNKVYLNPYTGAVVYREDTKTEFFTVLLALHMNLLLGDQLGHEIVRWSVVCFVMLLISGMVLWWPRKWKAGQLKKSFTVKWSAGFKRLNYDLHNVFGFYTFTGLLVIALSGLVWSFENVDQAVQYIASGGRGAEKLKPVSSDTTGIAPIKNGSPADIIFRQVRNAAPGTAYYLYNFPVVKNGTVNISAYQSEDNLYEKMQYKYDRYSGSLLQAGKPFDQLSVPEQVKALNYDLHIGTVFGLTGKILAFLASLISAALPVTGFLIWRRKR